MEGFNEFSRYNSYIRYMEMMDNMDNLESMCDVSIEFVNDNSNLVDDHGGGKSYDSSKIKDDSDSEETSDDDDDVSEDCFESDSEFDGNCSILDLTKKKVDVENPYRGLKDSGNPLEIMTDVDFSNCYKFSKKTTYDVMEMIKSGLIKHTNRGSPVPPLIELLITLKYLTTGSIQKKAMNGVSQSTISRINTRVTKLVVALQKRFIQFPNTTEAESNKVKFYNRGKFPDVIGCLGSTHVGVRAKGIRNSVDYINENGYHSVRIQVHQLMLEDEARMTSYKTAIMNNKAYIEGKTVMDVGAGSGILSLFCALAGAAKVYAVEASQLAKLAIGVVKENKLQHIVEVIHSKVEDVVLPNDGKVDLIISEWMGFYLLHEGMLDSVLFARDKFLKPGGHMFPQSATVYMAPCSVPSMYEFWKNIHGIKMETISTELRKVKGNKPEIINVASDHLLSEKTALCWINLKEDKIEDLDSFTMKQILGASKDGHYQGMCLWFDCQFPVLSGNDSEDAILLCTSPFSPPTHWKQTVIVLPEGQIIEKGQPIAWELNMKRSDENSRRYVLQLTLLDPQKEHHPSPCSCYMTKCIVIRTFLEQHPSGEETFDNVKNNESDNESSTD